MRSTALWLATAAMVAGGQGVSRIVASPVAAAIVAGAWPLAVALAIGGALFERWRRGALALALLLVALVRGIVADDRGDSTGVPAPARGPEAGVQRFAVREASWPGGRCQALVVPDGSDAEAWLELPTEACPLAEGDVVAIPTHALVLSRGPTWPWGVDPVEVARSRGARWALSAERAWRWTPGPTPPTAPYWRSIAALRQRLWQQSRGDDARAFVVSSLFGVRAALSTTRRRELGIAGLGHLIAVSGMQVSLVAWAAHRAMLRALAPWLPSVGLAFAGSTVFVLAYVGLVGAEAPSVRAAIMVMALGIAATLGRPAQGLAVLACTSCVMLLVRPSWVFDVGFQLSFAAMAAILRMPRGAGLALQSWRVGWAIMPVIVWHFGETGGWAVPANAIAVPVFGLWVTPLGILAIVTEPVLDALGGGDLVWRCAGWGAALILDVAHAFASAPRIGPAWVAGVAALVLVLGLWPSIQRRVAWDRWAPSRPICVLVIAATGWRATPPSDVPVADWIAFGAPRSPTLVVRPAGAPACVRNPSGSPHTWPRLLEALHVEAVGVVTADVPRRGAGPVDPPHVLALRAELEAAGFGAEAIPCVDPPEAAVALALETCARWGERPFAAVTGPTVRCFVAGDWRTAGRLQSDATGNP